MELKAVQSVEMVDAAFCAEAVCAHAGGGVPGEEGLTRQRIRQGVVGLALEEFGHGRAGSGVFDDRDRVYVQELGPEGGGLVYRLRGV